MSFEIPAHFLGEIRSHYKITTSHSSQLTWSLLRRGPQLGRNHLSSLERGHFIQVRVESPGVRKLASFYPSDTQAMGKATYVLQREDELKKIGACSFKDEKYKYCTRDAQS